MKILVIGGYGNFGKRLVTSLIEHYQHRVLVAGRSTTKARSFIADLVADFAAELAVRLTPVSLDVHSDDLVAAFGRHEVDVVVNASGPFHLQRSQQDYRVARACIAAGCHYIDLADDRDFVAGFAAALHRDAVAAGLMLVCGASTVPGLSSAVLDHYQPRFATMQRLSYGISPGNRSERGKATVTSILSYTGRPFTSLIDGRIREIYGWQDLRCYDFRAPIGKRWMGNCNIPDLELLPLRYPQLTSIRFQAGLEVSPMHLGLWLMAALTRIRLIDNWSRYSELLIRCSDWFLRWGSDCGGMFVELEGIDHDGAGKRLEWQLVAEQGVGPNVPTIAAELVIKGIADGEISVGASACMGFFTLEEFFEIAGRWGIYQQESYRDPAS